jgi:hypothetical protein
MRHVAGLGGGDLQRGLSGSRSSLPRLCTNPCFPCLCLRMQYLRAAQASSAAPAPAPGPVAPASATTADLSPAAFAGVSDAAHVEALRKFYTQNVPEKVAQVCVILGVMPCVWLRI